MFKFVLFVFAIIISTQAETLKVLTLEYPPYSYEKNGKISGITVALMDAILKELNWNYSLSLYPWRRVLAEAEHGKADIIFNPLKTPEREKYLYFSSVPLVNEHVVVIVRADDLETRYEGNFEALKGKAFCILRGFSLGAKADNAFKAMIIKKIEVEDVSKCGLLLKEKRVSGIIYDKFAALVNFDTEITKGLFLVSSTPVEDTPSYFAIPKKSKLAERFSEIDKINLKFYRSNKYEAVIKKELKRLSKSY